MHTVIETLKSIRLRDGLVMLLMFVGAFGIGKLFGPTIGLLFLILGVGVYLIRDRVDWWSPQVHQVLVVLLIAVFGMYLGRMIGSDKYWVVALLIGGVCVSIHSRKPEYMLLIAAVLVPNMFALIPGDFLQVKGFFKLRDLLLMGVLALVAVQELIRRDNIKFMFSSISARAILAFCFIVTLFIVFTSIRHSCSLDLGFRMGRDYYYYLFFFAVLHSLRGKKRVDFMIKAMIGLSMLFAILYIVQALSGGALHILRAYPLARESVIWGVPLARSYAPFGFAWGTCYGLLGVGAFAESRKSKLVAITACVLILGAIFFTFGRTAWYKTAVIILFVLVLLPRDKKKNFVLRMGVVLLAFGLFMLLIGVLRYGSYELMFTGFMERAGSGVSDIARGSGTYGYRSAALVSFYHTVIKKNLLFGIGFLYPRTELTQIMPFETVIWVENPLACILNTMGIMGLLSYILLYVVFVVRGVYIFKRIRNPVYKGFIIGFVAWYIADWMGIVTTAEMISCDAITVKALCIGLTECMYRVDKT
jgi:hypothetical protein